MSNNDHKGSWDGLSRTRVRETGIDLRGATELKETSVSATLGKNVATLPPVASFRAGLKAYGKTKGKTHIPGVSRDQMSAHLESSVTTPTLRTEESIKRVRLSILKALHSQSNAGSVNLREVSEALDQILREK